MMPVLKHGEYAKGVFEWLFGVYDGTAPIEPRSQKQFAFRNRCYQEEDNILYLVEREFHLSVKDGCILVTKNDPAYPPLLLRPATSDIDVFYEVFLQKIYQSVIDLMKGSTKILNIVDAGSNIGLSILYFHLFFPHARFTAIEPSKPAVQTLRQNLKLNQLLPKATIIEAALWNESGKRLLLTDSFRDGRSWAASVMFDRSNNNAEKTTTISLSDVLKKLNNPQSIDLLKVDIEGAEKVLFESQEFIQLLQQRVRFLCVEVHHEFDASGAIYTTLQASGFSVVQQKEILFGKNEAFSEAIS